MGARGDFSDAPAESRRSPRSPRGDESGDGHAVGMGRDMSRNGSRRVLAYPHRVQQMRLSAIPPNRRHTGSVGSPVPSSVWDGVWDASFASASFASASFARLFWRVTSVTSLASVGDVGDVGDVGELSFGSRRASRARASVFSSGGV